MATLYGSNYQKAYVNDPKQMINRGEFNGKIRAIFDSHTFVANVNAIADIVKLGKIRKGMRFVDALVKCGSLGTTGIFSLGYAIGDAGASGGEPTADADGFIVVGQLDAGGQAVLGRATSASAAVGKQFADDCDIQAVFTEATDAAAGVVLYSWVFVIAD